jgi:superfamily II DNA or RNA helicase
VSAHPGRSGQPFQEDLFSVDPSANMMHVLASVSWPAHEEFPFNRAGSEVGSLVLSDLAASSEPLIVAGYASVAELIEFVAEWEQHGHDGRVRVLLGAEPFPTDRFRFTSASAAFTDEVRSYWEGQGVSLRLSAKVLQALEALGAGRLDCRFIHGSATLHAKVYVGTVAATVGSSNFTRSGLALQLEANARFERAREPKRYEALALIGENLWAQGAAWNDELAELLRLLLQSVPWQEALARACAVLLEGEWARRYLEDVYQVGAALWPSQRAGIAQALWIIETVGSALVADATGSGKTRMGAHLVRAVRDRLWSTGRARRDLAVVVCPPAVERTWRREANVSGVNLETVSHGLLSRGAAHGPRVEEDAVNRAEILAVDESHNFLNPDARRTRQVRESRADHVLLFTATPINRGPTDLLQLVGFLGADNFEEQTLDILRRLDRRHSGEQVLAASEVDRLRREIQRFTVRRTKSLLNELVERETDAYIHPDSGRVCRYPRHDAHTYDTGESPADEAVAERIRSITRELSGVSQLERNLAVPAALRAEYSDERWLAFRLSSVRGLAAHHVLGAMRSSRAALWEHLAGTGAAQGRFGIRDFKTTPTGDVVGKLGRLAEEGPPEVRLDCSVPMWLTDPDAWAESCRTEQGRYLQMLEAGGLLSDARELAKARLLASLLDRHERVLAFDRHPITLEQLRTALQETGVKSPVLVATGSTQAARRQVEAVFDRTSAEQAVALCSDAMNEGLNLQGASAIVHLDLPTTLRVAEQRIGRIDRMDSPHDVIEAYWPKDRPAFATRANELLAQRAAESEALLGSNLQVPLLSTAEADEVVDVEERIEEAESPAAETWDGIRDAFEPVRDLVSGSNVLVPVALYDQQRTAAVDTRVISVVSSERLWAFLAIRAGSGQGAPRWLLLEGEGLRAVVGLDDIADRLRAHLVGDPPAVRLEEAVPWLDAVLDAAARAEQLLLPRRMRNALEQLGRVAGRYAVAARKAGQEPIGARWAAIAGLADQSVSGPRPDPYAVAEVWLQLVRPRLDAARIRLRHQAFVLLRDIERDLDRQPVELDTAESAFGGLARMAPVDERVAACILGVPVAVGAAADVRSARGSR